jgi:hypothetical protein
MNAATYDTARGRPEPQRELIRVQTHESRPRPFSDRPASAADEREFDLAVREAAFKRRETALKRIELAMALTPVPVEYFRPGRNSDEGDRWAKRLGST